MKKEKSLWKGAFFSLLLHSIFITIAVHKKKELPSISIPPMTVTLAPVSPVGQSPEPTVNPGIKQHKSPEQEKANQTYGRAAIEDKEKVLEAIKPLNHSQEMQELEYSVEKTEEKPPQKIGSSKDAAPSLAKPKPPESSPKKEGEFPVAAEKKQDIHPKKKAERTSSFNVDNAITKALKRTEQNLQESKPLKSKDAVIKASDKKYSRSLDSIIKEHKNPLPTLEEEIAKESSPQGEGAGGELGSVISQGELDALRAHIGKHWHVPASLQDADDVIVTLTLHLTSEGYVENAHATIEGGKKAVAQMIAESAMRAVKSPACQPFPVPKAPYAKWKVLCIKFQLKEIL